VNERRNVNGIITLEALWGFGASFVTMDILSALIYAQGGSAMLVAALVTGTSFITNAPQLIVPYLQQRVSHPIRGAGFSQAFMATGWVIATVVLCTATAPLWVMGAAIGAAVSGGLGSAFNYPYYQQMRLRLFPARTRSKSYSTALFFAQIAGMLGALACVPLLNWGGKPTQENYLFCFAVASVLFVLSTSCYLFLRDSNPPPKTAAQRRLSEFLREYVGLLRGDRNLRVFLFSETFAWMSGIGAGLLTYYAVREFGEGIAPQCTVARCAAALIAVPLAHFVVTRLKPRVTMVAYYLCVIATFALILAPWRVAVWAAMFSLGAAMIFRVNYLFHLVAAMSGESNRAHYFALSSAVGAPFMLFLPALGAWVLRVTNDNYTLLFALSAAPMFVGMAIVLLFLKDPPPQEADVNAVPRVTLKKMSG
jgi:MFS family permease